MAALLRSLDLDYRRRALQSCVKCAELDRLVDRDCDIEVMRQGLELVCSSRNGIVDFSRLPQGMCNLVKRKLTKMARYRFGVFTWEPSKTGGHILVALTDPVRRNMSEEHRILASALHEKRAVSTIEKLLALCRGGKAPLKSLLGLTTAVALPRDLEGLIERHPDTFRLDHPFGGQTVELVSRDETRDSTLSMDVSTPEGEQRILSKFQELIGLTLEKRCPLGLLLPLKAELQLPELRWDNMLSCHPDTFYVSSSRMVKTAFLREFYDSESEPVLRVQDPLVTIRNRYAILLMFEHKDKKKHRKRIFYNEGELKLWRRTEYIETTHWDPRTVLAI